MNTDQYLAPRTTERLSIERLQQGDINKWANFFDSPDATLYLPNPLNNLSIERAKTMIEKQFTRYNENKYGLMKLSDRSSNEFIGLCGLLIQNVDNIEEVEIGYHVFPCFWNLGLATEAAKSFRNLAFENNLAASLISIIHVDNIASQKVALKNGMKKEKQTTFFDLNVFIYRIKYSEWNNNKNQNKPE